MSETVPQSVYQPLHHFIADSPWDDRPVRALNAKFLNEILGNSPYTGLLIDETPFTKKGTRSVGVARQWNGQLGKVDNCQVAVFSALCDSYSGCLLDARLYLPKEWTSDPKRCRDAGVPGDRIVYKSKAWLALELVDEADAFGVQYEWIGVDAGYGKDPRFLRELVARGKTFFADIHKTQRVYLNNPTQRKPLPGSRGPAKKLTVVPKPLTVAEWVAAQPKRKWKNVMVGKTAHGKRVAKILHGRVWVWDGREQQAHCWHLIVRRRGKDDDKHTFSNAPGDFPTKPLAWYQAQRCKIEQSFREAKQELGMDDYQVRGWRGWHHHVTITLMAMNFLLQEKLRFNHEYPSASLRRIRELIASMLPRNGFEVLLAQMAKGSAPPSPGKNRAPPR